MIRKFSKAVLRLRDYPSVVLISVGFVCGAALEFSMINWQVGQTNFYSVYKEKQAEKIAINKLAYGVKLSETIDKVLEQEHNMGY